MNEEYTDIPDVSSPRIEDFFSLQGNNTHVMAALGETVGEMTQELWTGFKNS